MFQMNFNQSIMSTKSIRADIFIENLVVNRYITLAGITSGCILATLLHEYQSLLLRFDTILKIHTAGCAISNKSRRLFPEIIRDRKLNDAVNRIDVKNFDDVKLVQNAGKGKKGGKKVSGGKSNKGNDRNLEQDKAADLKKDEEERLRKWNDDWEKKLKAQAALDQVPCCSAEGLCLKPKTQSNIWINVTRDKRVQDIQMGFMHIPVQGPKAPPLPKLVSFEPKPVSPPGSQMKKKGAKKKGKVKK